MSEEKEKQIVVSFNIKDVMLTILPQLWQGKGYVSNWVCEELAKAVLKDYNVRDTGYQLLHTYYDQICEADKRVIDTELSEAEKTNIHYE